MNIPYLIWPFPNGWTFTLLQMLHHYKRATVFLTSLRTPPWAQVQVPLPGSWQEYRTHTFLIGRDIILQSGWPWPHSPQPYLAKRDFRAVSRPQVPRPFVNVMHLSMAAEARPKSLFTEWLSSCTQSMTSPRSWSANRDKKSCLRLKNKRIDNMKMGRAPNLLIHGKSLNRCNRNAVPNCDSSLRARPREEQSKWSVRSQK